MNMSAQKLFEMYLNARRPIIYIRNFDFQSVDRLIEDVCKDYQIEEYSEANGVVNFKTKSHLKEKHGAGELAEYLSQFNSAQYNKIREMSRNVETVEELTDAQKMNRRNAEAKAESSKNNNKQKR